MGLATISTTQPLVASWFTLLAQEVHESRIPTTDVTSQLLVAVVLVGLFVLLTLEAAHRVLVGLAATASLLLVTYVTPFHLITFEGVRKALDINVLVLLASMMALVGVLKTTGAFEWGVAKIMNKAEGKPHRLLALVLWFTAICSAFLDNVTTVVFTTPMVLAVARQARLNPAALLLPMVMASNIGGTATLVGDPPNIMIGSGAGLSFLDFLEDLTFPCAIMIFWLEYYSRRHYTREYMSARAVPDHPDLLVRLSNPALARWLGVICAAVLVGFLTHHITGMPAAVPALVGAAAALVAQDLLYVHRERPTLHERVHGVLKITEEDIEWPTLAFFGFLFIVVGAAVNTGLIDTLAHGLEWAIAAGASALGLSPNGTLLFAALLICWVSGILSAVVDNIPFVAVAIPIIAGIIPSMQGERDVLWWALALGACLGGNGTPIGASANVTTIGLAERAGERLPFREFVRYASPMTAVTLAISSAYLVLHIYLGKLGSFAVMGGVLALLVGIRFVRRQEKTPPSPTVELVGTTELPVRSPGDSQG